MTRHTRGCLALGLAATLSLAAAAQQADDASVRQALVAAEDARAPSAADLQVLLRAARHADDDIQAAAVRALGRLERPELLDDLKPFLRTASAAVRAQAANAVAQAVSAGRDAAVRDAARALRDRLKAEAHPYVRGIVAAALGRLPYARAGDVASAEDALVDASQAGGVELTTRPPDRTPFGTPVAGVTLGFGGDRRDAPLPVLVGVANGLESLVRINARSYTPASKTISRLRQLAITRVDAEADDDADPTGHAEVDAAMEDAAARVRRLALQALVTAKAADDDTVAEALRDSDAQVRRLAVLAAPAAASGDDLFDHLARAFQDDEASVRLEAVRLYGRTLRQVRGCELLVAAIGDLDTHVTLEAIDQLGACAGSDAAVTALVEQADAIDEVGREYWHAPAHALVSLARVAPDRAAASLPGFSSSPVWQVRMYAASAAAAMGDVPALDRLARDAHPNVREAAIGGLAKLEGHEADDLYLAALASDDEQLVRTAARALDGSPARDVAMPRLLDALARLTRSNRDTSRDPRVAILQAVRTIGAAADAPALWRYLADFDPRIAALTAEVLTAWTGVTHAPATTRFAPRPPPVWTDVAALDGARARFLMSDGLAFEIELHAADAPATVARFVSLARAGYYDGLTFHRVVPNFVIQGGSPGANEYIGDGAYLRDEVGLRPHVRGAVGISTRGRDTGDAQIFIDLEDLPRLDHVYTVFASVVRGMDDVDAILEGAIIRRVEIVR